MTTRPGRVLAWALLIFAAAEAQAQIANPADTQRAASGSAPLETGLGTSSANMEAVIVEGHRSTLHEEDRIGPYAQPRWTAFRRFPSTRVYVRPEGYVGVEQWYRFKDRRGDGPTSTIAQTEIEFGLPHRVQLDLYLITRRDGSQAPTYVDNAVEVRYAFADWGRIWGNPTIYLELVQQDSEPNKAEVKMLLGDEIREGWHWGSNFVWEYTMGGTKVREYEWTFGLSHTLRDDQVSLGFELKLGVEDESGGRGDWERDYRLGPSVQYRPLPQMHIDFAPLFGLTSSSKRADVYAVVGWEFG